MPGISETPLGGKVSFDNALIIEECTIDKYPFQGYFYSRDLLEKGIVKSNRIRQPEPFALKDHSLKGLASGTDLAKF